MVGKTKRETLFAARHPKSRSESRWKALVPIQIGGRPDHGFSEPLGLLSDCHRRIEHFLQLLVKVDLEAAGGQLTLEYRGALEKALRYFETAVLTHTADEEASLFPRLRASGNPDARQPCLSSSSSSTTMRRPTAITQPWTRSCAVGSRTIAWRPATPVHSASS